MKKFTRTILAVTVLALVLTALTACDLNDILAMLRPTPACEHEWDDATCTAPKTCSKCNATEGEALAHTEEIDASKPATCTESGLTEGKHCSVCNTVLAEQETVEALGHDEVRHDGKEPDCKNIGWKAYVTCSRCDYTTYEELPSTGAHGGGEATCTSKAICSGCGDEYGAVNQDNHKNTTALTDTAKAPTCGEAGKEADTYCNDCKKTVAVGAELAATGEHDYTEDNDCTKANVCSVCGGNDGNKASAHAWNDHDNDCSTAEICTNANCNAENSTVKEHVFAKSDDCTADVKCNNCNAVKEGAEAHSGGSATCVAKAQCATCGKEYGELADHAWGTPVYTWAEDGSACTASRVCSTESSHTESAAATVTHEVTQAQTGDAPELTAYTAAFAEDWATAQTKVIETKGAFGYNAKAENGEKLVIETDAANAKVSVALKYAISESATLLVYSGADGASPAEVALTGSGELAWRTASFEATADADGKLYIAIKAVDGNAPTLLIDQIVYIAGGLNDKMLVAEAVEGDGRNVQTLTVHSVYENGAAIAVSAYSTHESHATASVEGNVVTVTGVATSMGGAPTIEIGVSMGGETVISASYSLTVYVPITTGLQFIEYTVNTPSGYYMLMNDIEFWTEYDLKSEGGAGDPKYITASWFAGIFDGNGHTIAVQYHTHWASAQHFSLFRAIWGGTVENLGVVVRSSADGYAPENYSAVLARQGYDATIRNCYIEADMNNSSNQWGNGAAFVLINAGNVTIEDSFVKINLLQNDADKRIGGTFVRDGNSAAGAIENVWGLAYVAGAPADESMLAMFAPVPNDAGSITINNAGWAGTVSGLAASGYNANAYDAEIWTTQDDGTVALKNGCSIK